ncbi:amidase [Nonomuraea roseoviolacea subsp. roseoviolacea]|uniref:Aspartyl-tRNA(Asn)/glutamyl-tRNA(Gln) amidotransferase subunit A n=1 Tax=Nonomuraea roseoviolacea subsp. carminata TaxID=160689 RepID=A0ABT1KEE3_9ACTN|nr:amidase [Nonomuraea roseoviolacea]MCP2352382.1 aspartyl-tRNA(Asn)/glutamyl-tRNA(Gln) amidotransferase subunit A [Nonomuraea roseoviolacea subsp. carminata]
MNNNTTTPPTIADLGAALRERRTSAVELARAALRQIEDRNPAVNAFVLIDEDGALAAAEQADADLAAGIDRGALHGVPVAVKDIIDMTGLPTTCGSASSFGTARASEDAEIVTRLRQAGAVIVGKTTLHEFAYGATGDRSVHGPSRNPIDPTRMSGGSSGGSAAAVASGMVPLAVGTDTAGSVRVPAALCGIVGFKPAYDALPAGGVYPLAPTLDHVGLFTMTSHDALVAYRALSGASHGPTPASVSPAHGEPVAWISPEQIAPTDPRVARIAHDRLARSGVDLYPVSGLLGDTGDLFRTFSALQGHEAFAVHETHLPGEESLIDPDVLARLRTGQSITAERYASADRARQEFRDLVLRLLAQHPVLAVPTVPIVAPQVDQRTVHAGDTTVETRTALLSLTSPWNMAGVPALSVPAGFLDGLPVGVQLITAAGGEDRLFAIATGIENAATTPA